MKTRKSIYKIGIYGILIFLTIFLFLGTCVPHCNCATPREMREIILSQIKAALNTYAADNEAFFPVSNAYTVAEMEKLLPKSDLSWKLVDDYYDSIFYLGGRYNYQQNDNGMPYIIFIAKYGNDFYIIYSDYSYITP